MQFHRSPLSAFARAVWPGAMVSCCGVCAAVSTEELGFWVCGSGGGSSSERYYLQVVSCKEVAHHSPLGVHISPQLQSDRSLVL